MLLCGYQQSAVQLGSAAVVTSAKLSLPGNRVGLKTTGPPLSCPSLWRSEVLGPNADSLCQIRLTAIY